MRRLFVTGASGLVGRRLLAHATAGGAATVVAPSRLPREPLAGVTWIRGDLRDIEAWRAHLDGDVVVAHLAAATGAADATEMHEINVEGTRRLVELCSAANVAGFLHVSSIAARFPDVPHYPYAASKREAEQVVRGADLPVAIVRPTMVLGHGSPILRRLRSLAGGPRIVVVGHGRTRVQPVDADELGAELARRLLAPTLDGGTREVGGTEVVTMEELLRRVRAATGRRPAPTVHLPYRPLRAAVAVARALLGRRLPLHPGQLASFVQEGVAAPGPAGEPPIATRGALERMLALEEE